jgi:AcrR family transcriptional regulator
MGVKERREREKGLLREEILDAARELFVAEGYQSVSMRKIAEKIEYSPTTIYLYFKDKADLIFHLCEETFAKLIQTMDMLAKQGVTDPLERLRRCGQAYVEFGLLYPNHYKVTFIMPHEHPALSPEDMANSMGMKAFARLREIVKECIAAGRLRPDLDPEAVSQVLWAGMHGLTSLLICHQDFPWVERERLIATHMDGIMNGFKAR